MLQTSNGDGRPPWQASGNRKVASRVVKINDEWYDIWYDMILYDIWYGMIWYDMIYDMIWYDMIWYDIWYDIWFDI